MVNNSELSGTKLTRKILRDYRLSLFGWCHHKYRYFDWKAEIQVESRKRRNKKGSISFLQKQVQNLQWHHNLIPTTLANSSPTCCFHVIYSATKIGNLSLCHSHMFTTQESSSTAFVKSLKITELVFTSLSSWSS